MGKILYLYYIRNYKKNSFLCISTFDQLQGISDDNDTDNTSSFFIIPWSLKPTHTDKVIKFKS